MSSADRRRAANVTGRAGELLVMLTLERAGIQAALVDRHEHDIWARTSSGRMVTIQVKTASAPDRSGPDFMKFDIRKVTTGTDVCAVVALQLGIVLFFRPDGLKSRIRVAQFTPEAQEASMRELLS